MLTIELCRTCFKSDFWLALGRVGRSLQLDRIGLANRPPGIRVAQAFFESQSRLIIQSRLLEKQQSLSNQRDIQILTVLIWTRNRADCLVSMFQRSLKLLWAFSKSPKFMPKPEIYPCQRPPSRAFYRWPERSLISELGKPLASCLRLAMIVVGTFSEFQRVSDQLRRTGSPEEPCSG